MGQFPYSTIPMEFKKDDFTAAFMEDVRRLLGQLQILADSVIVRSGDGTPEGVITAVQGSLYLRKDGTPTTTLYIKGSGTGNTGWRAI